MENKIIFKDHQLCYKNRNCILKSKKCGCFYCLEIFPPEEIKQWTDKDDKGVGQTGICPYCGVDSLIGDYYISIDKNLLKEMKKQSFSMP